jgi:hypothetical protein
MEVLRDFHDGGFLKRASMLRSFSLFRKFQVLLLSKIFGLLVL